MLNEDLIVAVVINCTLSNCKLTRKRQIGTSTGLEPMVSAVALQ